MTFDAGSGNVSRMAGKGKPGVERKYDRDAMTTAICDRLATGEPMTVICRDLSIPVKSVNDWRLEDEGIRAQFDEARDLGHDAIAIRMRATARGKGEKDGGDSTGDVQRDKLIINTDEKLLARWDPRRYGDRMTLSGDADAPLMSVSDEQLDARLAELLAKRGTK